MKLSEVIGRLHAEGITPHAFSNEYFQSLTNLSPRAVHEDLVWLGEVNLVARRVDADNGLTLTYFLPTWELYFQTFGICKWEPEEKDFEPATDDYQEALIAWSEKYPNQSFAWDFMSHYSPVKPVSKTVVEYHYAPEMLAA